MAGIKLPPLPLQDIKDLPYTLQEWLRKIQQLLGSVTGLIPWASIDKTGSNLTDIVTRNHNDLANKQGGTPSEYYHLTSAQNTVVGNTSGSNTGDQTISLTGDVTGSGIGSFVATVVTNANLAGPITSVGNATAIANSIALPASPTTTTQAPADNSTKIATTAYVDNAVLGQRAKEAVKYASVAALPSIIYANGSSGVGATLTGVALAAISLDGSAPAVADRVLIKNQVSDFQNGLYTVTATGSGIAVFVLTRGTDFDQASDIQTGDSVFVVAGSTLIATTLVYTGIDSPTMGTTSLPFVQAAGPGVNTTADALNSATTVIDISTAAAPSINQVLTATDSTHATWQAPAAISASVGATLYLYYNYRGF